MDLQRLVHLHVSDGLEGRQRAAADAHLESCPDCRILMSAQEEQQGLLRKHGRPDPRGAPDIWSGLRDRLERPSWEGRWRPGNSKR